jgi:hypothetical protein
MKILKLLTAAVAFSGLLIAIQPAQAQPNLDNMFLDEDSDDFDPGLPIGAEFPEIRALYQGEEISSIEQFFGDKGVAFFAMRSVDW